MSDRLNLGCHLKGGAMMVRRKRVKRWPGGHECCQEAGDLRHMAGVLWGRPGGILGDSPTAALRRGTLTYEMK